MDIHNNVDMINKADLKDWRYYEIEAKRQKLLKKLEEAKRLEENPELLKQKINEDITRRLKKG